MPAAASLLYLLAISAASLLLALLQGGERLQLVVPTRQGLVRGSTETTRGGRQYLAFYNLPFAKPPVGKLRFRSPQPPDSWLNIRDATVPGPVCPQNKVLGPDEREDCLYLNVFTPELKPAVPLPVMFFIHGGGWIGGTAKGYEAGYLLDHDIVLVTINYRIGVLGFLSTDDEVCPGNYGLKDQVAALKWVQQNIEAFGGDPGNVTIFGQSAGGASVNYHMLSPLSKGLFQKAISESGVASATWAVRRPGLDKARKVAALLGCPTEPNTALVECLRGVDAFNLTATLLHFIEWFFCPMSPFHPVIEKHHKDAFLSENILDLNPHSFIPWVVGVTKEEGALFTGAFVANKTLLQELDEKSDKLFPLCLAYQTSARAKLITQKIRNFYFSSGKLTMNGVADMCTDGFFSWKTDNAVRKYKDKGFVYYYRFSYRGKYSMSQLFGGGDKNLGAAHGDELLYLFSKNPYISTSGELPAKDTQVVKTMTKLWTDFARTGNPTPNDAPLDWPRVTSDDELEFLDIGEKLEVKKGLSQKRIDFWNSLPF
ncbi:venom carboxylesterase-6-like [Schistocerca americana]|uniref:venom carboxylesterase-6-like n=1 Tax=Schistocerca americana TaxID=7009 RepID=UPI001F501531|nr:venom carboxylesterase-6-like [Schistocerca americana]